MAKTTGSGLNNAEVSKHDYAREMAKALVDGMIQNPDTILSAKGAGRMDVYKELLRDDQVKSTFQQRRTATTNAEFYVDAYSDSAEDKAVADFVEWNMKELNFDEITDKMLYAIHFGYSVAELIVDYSAELGKIYLSAIKVRDRNRFKFDPDNNLILVKGLEKFPMKREKFWIHSTGSDHDDNPYGEGLAHALYWPVFFKRNGIKFWMIFLEKFGMPTATAKLSQAQIRDPEQRALALQVLDAVQADSGVVIPEDFVVELIEASRSGSVDYGALTDRMDAAIAKIVLSQTMTTDNGSSRSQSETHLGIRNEVIKADADLLMQSFNEQVIKRIVDLNFNVKGYPKAWRRTEPETDLVQLAERDNKIINLGYEPTEEYIKETYGEGWRKKAEPVPPQGLNVKPMGSEFAEVSGLTDKRVNHRRDQQSLIDGAEYLATQYAEMIGARVDKIKALIDDSQTLEEVQEKLTAMFAEPADDKAAKIIENANFFSRLMGLFRGKAA